jgi:hypothetical protein
MPERRIHLKFDKYLVEHEIVADRDYSTVHDRMDRDLQIYGHWNHQYIDFYHNIDGIRFWLRGWAHLAYQQTLTDYVRVALGHLVLDEKWHDYDFENDYELMKTAYSSYVHRGFCKCFFKE